MSLGAIAPDTKRRLKGTNELKKLAVIAADHERRPKVVARSRNCVVNVPDVIRHLDDVIRDMDEKYVFKGGEVARLRTMARLRNKVKDDWQQPKSDFKFKEHEPVTPYTKEEVEARDIKVPNRHYDEDLKHHLNDYDKLQRYLLEKKKQERMERQARMYDHKMESGRKLIKEQQDLLFDLGRVGRRIQSSHTSADAQKIRAYY